MLEILEFIFSEFWIWAGFTITAFFVLVIPVIAIADDISKVVIKKHEIDVCYEQLERDRCRNEHNKTEF